MPLLCTERSPAVAVIVPLSVSVGVVSVIEDPERVAPEATVMEPEAEEDVERAPLPERLLLMATELPERVVEPVTETAPEVERELVAEALRLPDVVSEPSVRLPVSEAVRAPVEPVRVALPVLLRKTEPVVVAEMVPLVASWMGLEPVPMLPEPEAREIEEAETVPAD